jgi:hypothetical protein
MLDFSPSCIDAGLRFIPTGKIYALHPLEWEARYDLTIRGLLFSSVGVSGSRLIRETAVKPDLSLELTAGPTATRLACVKFLPVY